MKIPSDRSTEIFLKKAWPLWVVILAGATAAIIYFDPVRRYDHVTVNQAIALINNCEVNGYEEIKKGAGRNTALTRVLLTKKDGSKVITEPGTTQSNLDPIIAAARCE